MHTPLRIGLIGAGMVSVHHLRAWESIDCAEVVAIADPDLAQAREKAEAFGIGATFARAQDLIATAPVDALDIAAPVEVHGDLCRLGAAHGLPILCQKPLAATAPEAARIAEDINGQVPLMVHENWRFRPNYRQIKAWTEEGQIGEIVAATMRVRSSGLILDAVGRRPALARQPFLARLPRFLVFEVLVHHLDVLTWLLGDLVVTSAEIRRICPEIAGEDTAFVALQAANEIPVQLSACLSIPGAPGHIADHLEIIGTKGAICLNDSSVCIAGELTASTQWEFEALYAASYEGALREFCDALLNARPFEAPVAQHVACLKVMERIYEVAQRSVPSA